MSLTQLRLMERGDGSPPKGQRSLEV